MGARRPTVTTRGNSALGPRRCLVVALLRRRLALIALLLSRGRVLVAPRPARRRAARAGLLVVGCPAGRAARRRLPSRQGCDEWAGEADRTNRLHDTDCMAQGSSQSFERGRLGPGRQVVIPARRGIQDLLATTPLVQGELLLDGAWAASALKGLVLTRSIVPRRSANERHVLGEAAKQHVGRIAVASCAWAPQQRQRQPQQPLQSQQRQRPRRLPPVVLLCCCLLLLALPPASRVIVSSPVNQS